MVEKQQLLGWGDSVVEMVSADLRRAFPATTGFSPRNVWDMRRLYESYTAPECLAQTAQEIDHGMANKILRQPVAELGGDEKRPALRSFSVVGPANKEKFVKYYLNFASH
ncbi:MAG: DUF1016 N-terminal domain-containing protein [Kiritimatiellae bacterium]|nr:DUF1016 N-terminal domain-containing protein [Kiritimatiellia bacterium]